MPPLAWALAILVAVACIACTVTYRMYDPDLWQHLRVGAAIWKLRAIPHTQLWSWPTYGAPDVLPSWLFRALLWPFWAIGHEWGLAAWRWLTTLGAFALLWAATRRMAVAAGPDRTRSAAAGLVPLAALVWCALIWRQRTQCRPETLVAVLMGLQIWLLEARRAQQRLGASPAPARAGLPRDGALWLIPIACVWANAHISWYLAPALTGMYLLDEWVRSWRGDAEARATRPGALAVVLIASLAVCFLNPFGWRALWQPFEFFLHGRHEPIFRTIGELQPIQWITTLTIGAPIFVLLVPGLALARLFRRRADVAELLVIAFFLPQALMTQRFLGYFAIAVAPFFARDLAEAFAAVPRPALLRRPWPRAVTVATACVLLALPELLRPGVPFGIGFDWKQYPVRACDYIEREGVRGRDFNAFWFGGYLLWRFWPERDRLPFMDIHQAGTREDRDQHAYAFVDPKAWRRLDQRRAFEWLLLPRVQYGGQHLLDELDADSTTWALVFMDDAAVLYLRRTGRLAKLAERDRYHYLPAGDRRLASLGELSFTDSLARGAIRAELERNRASSEWNGGAHSLLANVALNEGRWTEAVGELRAALGVAPAIPELHKRLALALYWSGDPAAAVKEFREERWLRPSTAGLDAGEGAALRALGRTAEARQAYERALARNPNDAEARDSLNALPQR